MFRDAPPVGSCSRTSASAPFTLGREASTLSQVLDQLELRSGVRAFGRPWGKSPLLGKLGERSLAVMVGDSDPPEPFREAAVGARGCRAFPAAAGCLVPDRKGDQKPVGGVAGEEAGAHREESAVVSFGRKEMDVALTLLKLRMPSRGHSARPVRTRGRLERIPGLPAGRKAAGGAGAGLGVDTEREGGREWAE